ncbi:MAG: fasciclin domain-containing protein [Bacteroidales bacterium]|nr:fasciclin domain-containing protein [Bacteroidales bacterium]MCF8398580.1 fasciclin domain-containing protein [Bacteroidales bacterium]
MNNNTEEKNIVETAIADERFTSLVAALQKAGLAETLEANGPFTVFAPVDAAFVALLDSNDEWNALDDIPVTVLESVLTYHVVSGANVLSSDLSDGQLVTSLNGEDFTVNINNGNVSITDANDRNANIVAVDVQAGNGVIHVLDQVILP